MSKPIFCLAVCLAIITSGCSAAPTASPPEQPAMPSTAIIEQAQPPLLKPAIPEPTGMPTASQSDPASPSASPTPPRPASTNPPAAPTTTTAAPAQPADWRELPVIPVIGDRVIEIYLRGLELGNRPGAFSKVGDCGSTPAWFLGDFDHGARYYRLGEYDNLETAIAAYQGSFARTSLAAKSGFNASSIFSPLWANAKECQRNESPLACEYRLHRPIAAFIMLGTNDVYHPQDFEPQMRRIIEFSIEQGVIPILSTKADNLEGDGSINATIAKLAQEYGIPLLNYWRALQDLPDQGLQDDRAHITWGPNRFDDPQVMSRGWPLRNLTALQTLDALWQALAEYRPTE